jgi:hypothetical protein
MSLSGVCAGDHKVHGRSKVEEGIQVVEIVDQIRVRWERKSLIWGTSASEDKATVNVNVNTYPDQE